MLAAMSDDPLSVCVEFDRASAPVTGCLRTGGEEMTFTGWADLFALLRAIAAGSEIQERA
jgi:hypothetical protein